MFAGLLRMVGVYAQVGKEKLFSAWMAAPPVRLDGHKNSVNVVQGLRVVCFQNPALLTDVVLVEDAEVEDLLLVRPAAAPGLKRTRIFDTWLRIKIVGVENQSLPL